MVTEAETEVMLSEGRGRPHKEDRWPLEAEKGKGTNSPLEPQGGRGPANTLTFRPVKLILDFRPPEL